jgi:hypothetical protein
MWLGSSQQLMKVDIRDIPILTTTVQVTDTARDLGVVIDSQLSLAAHVSALSRSGYYIQLYSPHGQPQKIKINKYKSNKNDNINYANSLRLTSP